MPDKVYVCQNCGANYGDEELEPLVGRVGERVSEGELMPAGECTKCGAACHEQYTGAVFIEIRGGLIVGVNSTTPGLKTFVIDYDNVECEPDEESEANLALLNTLADRMRSVEW